MAILSRDHVDKVQDFIIEKVDVPEWKGTVCLKVMSGIDRASMEAQNKEGNDLRLPLLVRTLCDEHGVRLYADDEEAVLGSKSSVVINRLTDTALKLNYLTAKAVDELQKN